MKILIACEYSGIVRDAFIERGHDAISCDILPTERPGKHYQGYLEDFIGNGQEWDMIIAHPPCTYLSVSGYHWNYRRPERMKKTEQAIAFFMMIANRDCPKIAIENPVSIMSTRWRKPDQIIQPYQFGHDASKATCLWLKGLLPLKIDPLQYVEPRYVNEKPRWSNQTDGGYNKLPPSETRGKERAKTYQGIADAMARCWG